MSFSANGCTRGGNAREALDYDFFAVILFQHFILMRREYQILLCLRYMLSEQSPCLGDGGCETFAIRAMFIIGLMSRQSFTTDNSHFIGNFNLCVELESVNRQFVIPIMVQNFTPYVAGYCHRLLNSLSSTDMADLEGSHHD